MPTHCCVPDCTKKGYREDDGSKVSYFVFPKEKVLRKKWIHAIRREEGKYLKINSSTKVCSRHFRTNDLKKTLAGKMTLQPGAVPSLFSWTRTSPRKRKAPAPRESGEGTSSIIADSEADEENTSDDADCDSFSIETSEADVANLNATLTHEQVPKTPPKKTPQKHKVIDDSQEERISQLEQQITELQAQVEDLRRRNEQLLSQLFTVERFKENNSALNFYTGFPNWDTFMAVFRYLNPGPVGKNITYWLSSKQSASSGNNEKGDNESKRGRNRTLRPLDEYFLVMCRLRQGFREEHLGHLFQISMLTVSRIFISWINFMYLKLGQINIWPSRQVIDRTMPEDFKKKYSSTRVIIDCTEIKCQMPSSLHLNGELFSNYKHHTTLKGLIGISPGGAITFISQLYTGSISDREIVVRSGLLDLPLKENDSIMADKGFTIQDLLRLGVSLNIPPFLGSSAQMPEEDVILTQEIASLRIHVERAINKIKNFHIWDGIVPLHQFTLVNQMWAVCAILCNAQSNIISV